MVKRNKKKKKRQEKLGKNNNGKLQLTKSQQELEENFLIIRKKLIFGK